MIQYKGFLRPLMRYVGSVHDTINACAVELVALLRICNTSDTPYPSAGTHPVLSATAAKGAVAIRALFATIR